MDERYKNAIALNMSKSIETNIHFEALKCQAIIERTIVFRSIKEGNYKNIEINLKIDEIFFKAIEETKNKILMVNNNPIMAMYHVSCGGSTDNSENILSNKIDYLRRVTCEECGNNNTFDSIVDVKIEDLCKNFGGIINFDFIKSFNIENIAKIISRNESKRVENIAIFNQELSGTEFANKLNLNSSKFTFAPKELRFFIRGVGHGLGLCQYGANEKAKNNWKCEDILKYYYTNITISEVDEYDSSAPLKRKIILIDPGHGGKDYGIISADNFKEKDIMLSLALKLRKTLQENGATVYLTRDSDEYISLDERAKEIKKIKPDFSISIHLNDSKFEEINGMEGIYYCGDSDGKNLGEEIFKRLNHDLNVKNRGVREGKIYLLKECTGSAIYMELGYLSNSIERQNLVDEKYLELMSNTIKDGILSYYLNKLLT